MDGAPPCVGCGVRVRLPAAEVERLLAEYLAAHPGASRCDDATWRARLARCEVCADLAAGTTCRHCGCLVAVRVRLATLGCPHPGTPAWQPVEPGR